ncbi:MAG: HAD-IB family phosphatase [Methylococcales bacterium]|nr:HAD-IB family phosphatase [Methylococcales bacterium]MDD5753936.1 HAD-IB family phosphatase [Methylococcales bacterium]
MKKIFISDKLAPDGINYLQQEQPDIEIHFEVGLSETVNAEIVCFDCDSTLSKIEGIDELARRIGLGDELAKLTDAAMNGDVSLEAIYGKRLDLIKPNRVAIEWVADLYIAELVEGVTDVFTELAKHNKTVHIISGGLLPAILPLAKLLNVPEINVHAVDVYFAENGDYVSYEIDSPLAKNGGKAAVVKSLNATNLVLIGDGKTDLEAQQTGAKVIGFGGVVNRKLVRENADFFVADKNLTAVLPYIL